MILDKTNLKVMNPGIYWFQFPSQYLLCSTFIRPQEYYESPFPDVRGKFFTLDHIMDRYAASKHGRMTYFQDWAGFNIPGHVVENFHDLFRFHFSEKEKWLMDRLPIHGRNKFYVIGTKTTDASALRHEIAHALYYLDDQYRKDMDERLGNLPAKFRSEMREWLLETGYDESVVEDEIHAYLIEAQTGDGTHDWIDLPKDQEWFSQYYRETTKKLGMEALLFEEKS